MSVWVYIYIYAYRTCSRTIWKYGQGAFVRPKGKLEVNRWSGMSVLSHQVFQEHSSVNTRQHQISLKESGIVWVPSPLEEPLFWALPDCLRSLQMLRDPRPSNPPFRPSMSSGPDDEQSKGHPPAPAPSLPLLQDRARRDFKFK